VYNDKLRSKLRALRNFKPVPFATVKSENDYNDRELYVYYYAPLIFTAIEKEIGEQAMIKWIRLILQTPAAFTNYQFVEQTLSEVVNNKSKLELIRSKYFTGDGVINNIATTLGLSSDSENTPPTAQGVAKTYYYFFFTKPMIDAGAPENRMVKYTDIQTITCTDAELSNNANPIFKRINKECENAAGCSSDFNTYETAEKAKAALERWLKPYTGSSRYIIKKMEL
jgi:hypothetical protein